MDEIIQTALEDMIPYMAQFAVDASTQVTLGLAAKAAAIKSYEYLMTVLGSEAEDAFFLLPALRGICEDYIVLKFLATQLAADADAALRNKAHEDLYASANVQWAFFTKNRPKQILYYKPEFASLEDEARKNVREIVERCGYKPANSYTGLPSVRQMAGSSGLAELYDYVYHATSSMVHFSPRILLRMGWGDLPQYKFSTTNFGIYYRDFALFYGSYMFVQLFEWLIQSKVVDDGLSSHLEKIKKSLQDKDRWPELVTFEELNIRPFFQIILFDSPESANGS